MFKPKIFLLICSVFLMSWNVFAQAETERKAEPNFEIILQVLVGSNTGANQSIQTPNLNEVISKLKKTYSFSNFRLADTFLQRVGNTGNIDYKGITSNLGESWVQDTPVFSEWTLSGLRTMPASNGQNSVQFQHFRFGAKVPIRTGFGNTDGGKPFPIINYEPIGLTIQRLGVRENTPTVIGSLVLPKTDELVFLILTVKPESN